MAHEHRLQECQEKFETVEKAIGTLWDKKSNKVNGWGLVPQVSVSLLLGLILFVIGTIFWGRLCLVEAEAKAEDSFIKEKQAKFQEKYQETNQAIILALQDLKKDVGYIKQNMEKKGT